MARRSRSQVRRPKGDDDVFFHRNAFFTGTMQFVEVPQNALYTNLTPPSLRGRRIHESANVRDLRFKELLNGDEPFSPDQLARIMADHETAGKPGDTSICTHSDYWNRRQLYNSFPPREGCVLPSTALAEYTDIAL